jgi:hypothetical protein
MLLLLRGPAGMVLWHSRRLCEVRMLTSLCISSFQCVIVLTFERWFGDAQILAIVSCDSMMKHAWCTVHVVDS